MCVWGSHKIRVWCKSSRSLSLPVPGKTATWKGWMGRLWARVFIYEKIQSSVIAPIQALIINQLSCTANAVWYQVSKSIYKKGWKQCWFLWAPNVVWIWTIRNGLTLWCLFSGYWQCLGEVLDPLKDGVQLAEVQHGGRSDLASGTGSGLCCLACQNADSFCHIPAALRSAPCSASRARTKSPKTTNRNESFLA